MPLDITITDAGIAEIVNAVNTGTDPVLVSEIGLGSGEYTPSAAQTAMVSETKRLTTFGGTVVADDTIHVLIKDESTDAYSVTEIGLFTDSGTLLAIYSQTGSIMEKNASSSLLLAVDIALASISAASLTFGDLVFSNPPASTTVQGVVELADSAEMATGADANRVPPVNIVAAYVGAQIAALIDSSPGTLDTLNELAAALGDDPNFATTITNALALKAPLASPALSGNPTAPTQAAGNNTTRLANTAFVSAAIAALVDSSPGTLDTLNELAAALGDDPNFATTMTNALALKSARGANDSFAAGTTMLFMQASAPTGWTKSVTHNNKALRIVSGAGGASGGSVDFTAAFASKSVAGTVANKTAGGSVTVDSRTLATSQMPSHRHRGRSKDTGYDYISAAGTSNIIGGFQSGETGSLIYPSTESNEGSGGSHNHTSSFAGTAHNHTFTGTAINLAVKYVDAIICIKD
ncbi:MAG: hypothetical protein AB9Q19_12530 [Candidatus Reddybacter sp.]